MAIVEHKPERGDPKPLILGVALLVLLVLGVGFVIYSMLKPTKGKTITLTEEQAKQQSNTGPAVVTPGPPMPAPTPLDQAKDPGATLINLEMKQATVPEIVEALAKQANVKIQGANRGQSGSGGFFGPLATKRIDFAAKDQPFWVAMRELCKSADMHPYAGWDNRDNPSTITLQQGNDGTRDCPAVTVGSSVIVLGSITSRLDADLVGTRPPSRSLNVSMSLYVEPKLNAYRIARVGVIEAAVDENGTSLMKPADYWADRQGGSHRRSNWMSDVNIALNNPTNAGQKIARLRGYVSVAVTSGETETIKIKDPLKVKNQDHKVGNTMIRIVQVRKQSDTSYETRFQADSNSPIFKEYEVFSKAVKLFDAKGKEIQHGGGSWGGGSRNVMDFGLYFNGSGGVGEATEMQITLPKDMREVRVPFEFTDLPLPH